MPIKFSFTAEQARDIIRATSVYARDLASPEVREQNMEEIKRLDKLRHKVEAAVDKAA